MVYDNGLCIAVGDSGSIVSSDDGDSWTHAIDIGDSDINNHNSVAFGGGRRITVGEFSKIRYSDDNADNRTPVNLATTTFKDVGYDGSGNWLAVGLLGIAWRSTDVANWTEANVYIEEMPNIELLGFGP